MTLSHTETTTSTAQSKEGHCSGSLLGKKSPTFKLNVVSF